MHLDLIETLTRSAFGTAYYKNRRSDQEYS